MATDASETEAAESAPDAYRTLLKEYRRVANLRAASGVLSWDQQVMMPEGGTPARSQQLSTLSGLSHELLTDDGVGKALAELDSAELTPEQSASVREIRRRHDRAAAVPNALIEEMSTASSEALPAWERAKADDDFESFAPHLETHVELSREYAEHIDPGRDPYAVLFEEFEPCLSLERAESILATLKNALVPMIEEIRHSEVDLATDAFTSLGEYPADGQEELCREVLSALGYPWERGRLDTAPHPFSSGTTFDARVTTRFDESDPLGSLLSTVHEFGHATYTLGLPDDHYGTPLGEDRDLSVHESQSRLWENHVGRSRAFWEGFLPTVAEQFPQAADVTPREAYEAANQVYENNLIRVEADELTYHLHVVIRYEIERDLIRGDLDVTEVPEVWNDKYEEYLGIRPDTDSEGCLQDIHWAHGNFGYFPTYSLGSAMAAQLYAAAEDDVDGLDSSVAAGEFEPLHEWLTESVHRHGARYETDELVTQATGSGFTADAFVDYVTEKYGALYDLDAV
ncbi:carboxypeptidase M32 [Halobellus salinus]|uniref:Metal-dependent carboxypeptidase n=1 Tax=Halobellus salinus TaxID=931585 RepID=A0A830EBB7_9EURY|nr:carboxypeptidase M32 [Halobellus salinus]GGI94914.1 carboxypeptidase M32 [Halobellus salinus]SMP20416.1 carboxypeptidase Taq Metallo peptidase. MEROPS family M32 [Halobellus salinus]